MYSNIFCSWLGWPFVECSLRASLGFRFDDRSSSTTGSDFSPAFIFAIFSAMSWTSSAQFNGISRILWDIFLISIEYILQNSFSGPRVSVAGGFKDFVAPTVGSDIFQIAGAICVFVRRSRALENTRGSLETITHSTQAFLSTSADVVVTTHL